MGSAPLNKLDASRRHLDVAIGLLFEDADIVPVHTLLFAASEVLKNLCDARGVKSDIDQSISDLIKPEYRTDFHNLMRAHALFFKHAERDPDAEIDLFKPEVNDFLTLMAVKRYQELTGSLTVPMTVFAAWFGWSNPDSLKEPPPNPLYARTQHLFSEFGRAERLMFGSLTLAISMKQDAVASARCTEFSERFPAAFESAMEMLADQAAGDGKALWKPRKVRRTFIRLPD